MSLCGLSIKTRVYKSTSRAILSRTAQIRSHQSLSFFRILPLLRLGPQAKGAKEGGAGKGGERGALVSWIPLNKLF